VSVLLSIMSYPGANDTVKRHWKYWRIQQADWLYGIGTTGGGCSWPETISGTREIGANKYILADHLPRRICDTIQSMLDLPWTILVLIEYDCLILKRIPVEQMEHGIAAHLAGHRTWNSKAQRFYHNPWIFMREAAIKFVEAGRKIIEEGVCAENTPESSPDVFFALVCERNEWPVQTDLWKEYSRNSLDNPVHLEEARQAVQNGVDVVHGIKTQQQLEYVTV
jgi:hypothetical protein